MCSTPIRGQDVACRERRVSWVRGQPGPSLSPQPENILCVNTTGHLVKIIDFGLARRYPWVGGRVGLRGGVAKGLGVSGGISEPELSISLPGTTPTKN